MSSRTQAFCTPEITEQLKLNVPSLEELPFWNYWETL